MMERYAVAKQYACFRLPLMTSIIGPFPGLTERILFCVSVRRRHRWYSGTETVAQNQDKPSMSIAPFPSAHLEVALLQSTSSATRDRCLGRLYRCDFHDIRIASTPARTRTSQADYEAPEAGLLLPAHPSLACHSSHQRQVLVWQI